MLPACLIAYRFLSFLDQVRAIFSRKFICYKHFCFEVAGGISQDLALILADLLLIHKPLHPLQVFGKKNRPIPFYMLVFQYG